MRAPTETIIAGFWSYLLGQLNVSFTADASSGSNVLHNVSSVAGLVVGLPLNGPGVTANKPTLIQAIGTNTVTLSQNLDADGTAASFQTGFVTTGRRLQWWNQTAEQPALFCRHIRDNHDWSGESLERITINLELWVYVRTPSPDDAPDGNLNPILDAIATALVPPDNDDPLQLREVTDDGSPLLYWVRIDGQVDIDPGDIDQQGKIVIPVKLLLPA